MVLHNYANGIWNLKGLKGPPFSIDVLDASDVQTTINLLQQCITQSAEEVFGNRQVALGKAIKHSHKPWFDLGYFSNPMQRA